MKSFAIQEKAQKKKSYQVKSISVWFAVFLVVVFAVVAFFAKVNTWISYKSKIDLFNQNLQEIAFYFWAVDKDVAQMLVTIDELSASYQSGENILQTQSKKIDDLMEYIKKNKSYLQSLGFQKYEFLTELISNVWDQKQEIKELLGEKQPYNYLVILQNTNEKRPNWWFFWSFAFITVDKARITNLEIIDAYYPDYFAPNARIQFTPWQKKLFPNAEKFWFIAGNKFGFTDLDGKNLKTLYEMSFNTHYNQQKLDKLINPKLHAILLHKYIKGVIFVRLDMFTKYFPQLEKLSQEWQFVNANIDLIRGEVKKDKKEKYIKEANLFFQDNRKWIFKAVINNLEEIIQNRGINIYLSNVSSWLKKNLEQNNLSTVFQTGNIYAWDINMAQNKSDAFITKHLEIIDKQWRIITSSETDVIDFSQISKGNYTLKIYYIFNIPQSYTKFIQELEQSYHITMTEREKWILSLLPTNKRNNQKIWWETQGMVYFPKNVKIKNFVWGEENLGVVEIPFAKVQKYHSYITQKNQTKIIELDFEV